MAEQFGSRLRVDVIDDEIILAGPLDENERGAFVERIEYAMSARGRYHRSLGRLQNRRFLRTRQLDFDLTRETHDVFWCSAVMVPVPRLSRR